MSLATFTLLASAVVLGCGTTIDEDPATLTVMSGSSSILVVHGAGSKPRACLALGSCRWEWVPTPAQISWFNGRGRDPGSSSCASGIFNTKPGVYQAAAFFICSEAAKVSRPLIFASELVNSLGSPTCAVQRPVSNGTAMHADAELGAPGAFRCLGVYWDPNQNQFGIILRKSCAMPLSPPPPTDLVSVQAVLSTAVLLWQVSETAGAWQLMQVIPTPATPYLQQWTVAAMRASGANLIFPTTDPMNVSPPAANRLPFLLGRWATAMVASASSSADPLEIELREWMAQLQLANPGVADDTLFRYECAVPGAAPPSCHGP